MIDFIRVDIFYIILILSSLVSLLILSNTNVDKKTIFFISSIFIYIIIYTLFISLRPERAGPDTYSYVSTFQHLSNISSARIQGMSYYGNDELLFWPFMAIFKIVGISSNYFIALCGVISSFGMLISLKLWNKLCKNEGYLYPYLSILVLCSYQFVYLGNLLRLSIALPFIIMSITVMYRNTFISLLLFVISYGFHSSSIFIFPILILIFINRDMKYNFINSRFFAALIILLSIILSTYQSEFIKVLQPLVGDYFSQKIDVYSTHEFNITSIFNTFSFWFITLHVLFFIFVGINNVNLTVICLYSLLLLFSPFAKMSERFFPFILPLLPFLLYSGLSKYIKKNHAILLVTTGYLITGLLMILADSTLFTLSINKVL